MAKVQPLKLSDLKPSVEHPMANRLSDGRCLMHVKLTDLCMKSVEGLINSEKGAFFSLWFERSGGTMAIPTSGDSQRKFQFKTAPLREGEGHGSLECVHQALEQPRQHQLTCLGPIEHRLTVKAMDDVYDRTKKLMREAEEKNKKARAQEIKIVSKGRSKTKTILANASSQSATRKPLGRPAHQHKPHSSFSPKPTAPKLLAASTRSPRTLKFRERIIHLLALKPQKRSDIVTRLKKDTKRSESAMSNLDSILLEVSDVQHAHYNLKPSCYVELQVEDWPFYSDQDRQLLRRNLSSLKYPVGSSSFSPTSFLDTPSNKRPAVNKHIDTPAKKPKLSSAPQHLPPVDPTARIRSTPAHPLRGSHKPLPPSSSATPPSSTSTALPTFNPTTSGNHPHTQHNSSLSSALSTSLTTSASNRTSLSENLSSLPQKQTHLYSSFVAASSGGLSSLPSSGSMGLASGSTSLASGSTSLASGSTSLASGSTSFVTNFSGSTDTISIGTQGAQQLRTATPRLDRQVSNSSSTGKDERRRKGKKEKKKRKKDASAAAGKASVIPVVEASSMKGEQLSGARDVKGQEEEVDVKPAQPLHLGKTVGQSQQGMAQGGGEKQPEGASSTTNIPDFTSQFPPITSYEQRLKYKQVFNDEYMEYLKLKEHIDTVSREFAALSEQMRTVPENSEEAREVRRRIREKYSLMQQNTLYQDQKTHFEELHYKLSHIKQLVVDYDNSQTQ